MQQGAPPGKSFAFAGRGSEFRSRPPPPLPFLMHCIALCVKFLSAAKNFEPRQAKRSKSASYAVTLAPGHQARVVAKRGRGRV